MRRIAATPLFLLFLVIAIPLVASAALEEESYQSGLLALKGGDAQTAADLFSKAIQGHPDDHRYYNDRGVAYRVLGNPEKALADYTKAIQLKPEYVPALNNRGVLYIQQGSPDKAIEDFTEALKHGGLESKILTNIGWAYSSKEDHRNAVAYLEKALAARPLDPRSFILMAQSLERLGDTDRALKMYQLGLGLLHDTGIVERVEQRIADIEKGTGNTSPSREKPARTAAQDSFTRPSNASPAGPARDAVQTRQILPARPMEASSTAERKVTTAAAETGIDTLEALDQRARSKAVEKLSSAAAEIYRQGVDFLEKSDLSKALVRFEDTLNMERRKKNHHGVAWSSLEIGRVYAKLGDYVRASGQFDIAEKLFRRLKAGDETVLALAEQGTARKKAGQREQAALAFRQAGELAAAAGHHRLAKFIEDIGAGRATPQPAVAQRQQPVPPVQRTVERPSAPENGQSSKTAALANNQKTPPPVPSATYQKKQAPEQARESRTPGMADAAPKEALLPAAKPQSQPAQAVTSSHPVSAEREGRPAPTTRAIVRAETKPSVPVPASPPKPVAIETAVGLRGGVEAGTALSASPSPQASSVSKKTPGDSTLEKSIKTDLVALKKYRDAGDEANMIVVLERLAESYLHRKEHKKASHCLAAAVMFREKLGLEQGKDRVVKQRGLVREILGDSAGALEDFTWALALSTTKPGSRTGGQLELRSKKLANQMRLDEAKALAAYRLLWKARKEGDPQLETEACYTIAGLYEKANKTTEALSYYERSIASILADKARVYQKMGEAARAEEAYNLALETFKKLDYPKYVYLMKRLKAAKTLSKE